MEGTPNLTDTHPIWPTSPLVTRKASYSSGQCGADKTFLIAESARELTRRGRNVLIAQPTKLLADETAENEFRQRPGCPLIKVFHGGTVGRGVGYQLAEYLAEPQDEPQVVLTTHQVLPLLRHRTNLADWSLMIDESPQVECCKTEFLPE